MTREEAKNKIEELNNEIADLREKMNLFPQMNDTYYTVYSTGKIYRDKWDDCIIDEDRLEFGNVFRTENEAKEALRQIKKLLHGEINDVWNKRE